MYIIEHDKSSTKLSHKYTKMLNNKIKHLRRKNHHLKKSLHEIKSHIINVKLDNQSNIDTQTVYINKTTRTELYLHLMIIMILTFVYFKLLVFAGFTSTEEMSYSILGFHIMYITSIGLLGY